MALYPKLWKAIPAGWKSGSNIVLPDARGRTMIGAGTGAGLTARTLGALLGEEAHTLTSAESGMPTHGHGVTDPTHNHTQNAHTHLQVQHAHGLDGTGAHVVQDGAASGGGASLAVGGASYSLGTNQPATATNQNATATNIAASTGVTVNNATGVNATNAHNNMQPSLVLNWIIKT
jgi:microcystin-dependent protein